MITTPARLHKNAAKTKPEAKIISQPSRGYDNRNAQYMKRNIAPLSSMHGARPRRIHMAAMLNRLDNDGAQIV